MNPRVCTFDLGSHLEHGKRTLEHFFQGTLSICKEYLLCTVACVLNMVHVLYN